MSKKLQNVKAIQQMLDGTHKFQTKKTIGFSDTEKSATRAELHEVGDIWEETDASGNVIEIEQRDGFRVKRTKNSKIFDAVRETLNTFPNCRKSTCTCTNTHYLDAKMQAVHGMCFDCVIEMEHELRTLGKFDEYERERIRKNAEAWLQDAERDLELLKLAYTEASKFVTNGDGDTETWAARMTPEQFEADIQQKFEEFKNNFIQRLEQGNNEKTI